MPMKTFGGHKFFVTKISLQTVLQPCYSHRVFLSLSLVLVPQGPVEDLSFFSVTLNSDKRWTQVSFTKTIFTSKRQRDRKKIKFIIM